MKRGQLYLSLVFVFFVALVFNMNSVLALSIGDLIQSEWVNAALVFLLLFNFVITIFRDVFKSNYGAAVVISLVVAIAGSLSVVYYFGAFLSKIGLWLLILFVVAIALLMMRFMKGNKGKIGFIVLGVGSILWLAWLQKILCPPFGQLPFNVCQVLDVLSLIILAVVVVKIIIWLIRWATGANLHLGGGRGGWDDGKPGKPGKPDKEEENGEKGIVFVRMLVRGHGKVLNNINLTEFTEGIHSFRTERRQLIFVAHPIQDSFRYWAYDSPWGIRKRRNRMLKINLKHVLYRRKKMIRVWAIFAKSGTQPVTQDHSNEKRPQTQRTEHELRQKYAEYKKKMEKEWNNYQERARKNNQDPKNKKLNLGIPPNREPEGWKRHHYFQAMKAIEVLAKRKGVRL